jgi:hypothetical protein
MITVPGVLPAQSAEDAGFEPARAITPNTISNSTPDRSSRFRCAVLAGQAWFLNRMALTEPSGTETQSETLRRCASRVGH